MTQKTAIYVRVSTEEQAKEGISIDAQKSRLNALCTAKDYEVYDMFVDEGFSAGSTKRPEFLRMLDLAKNKQFDNILVYKIDRFSRNLKDLIIILDQLKELGINFISATEPIDTTSAIGRAFMQIIGVFAELERGMVAERVSLAFERKLEAHQIFNRAPLGYKYIENRLVIDPEAAVKVREIFGLWASGVHYKEIAVRYGVAVSSLYHIVRNPTYLGKIKYKNEIFEGDFDPIVDTSLFLQVNPHMKEMLVGS